MSEEQVTPAETDSVDTGSGVIRLGLNVPKVFPVGTFRTFENVYPKWKQEQCLNALAKRQRARVRFPKSQWIKNQNPFGSCASHGGTNAVERLYFEKTGKRIVLQPHFLYAHINGGRDRGALLVDVAKAIQQYGIPTLEDAPDGGKIFLSQYGQSELQRLYKRTVKAREVFETRSELALLTAIAQGFQAFVAVDVNNAFANYRGNGPVAPHSSGPGNHAISLDDAWYDSSLGEIVFDTPGSWGANMGDSDARWPITWKRHLAITNNYHVFYVIPEVRELPTLTPDELPPVVQP